MPTWLGMMGSFQATASKNPGSWSHSCKEIHLANSLWELGYRPSTVQPPDKNTAWMTTSGTFCATLSTRRQWSVVPGAVA